MKTCKIFLTLVVAALMLLSAVAAQADSLYLPDTTLVQPYRYSAPSEYPGWTTWTDIIADPLTGWDLKGVGVNWTADKVQLKIYTDYPEAGLDSAGQADIALGHNGVFDYGIKMSGPDLGKIYAVTAWTKTTDNPPLQWNNGNWIYAGKYDQSAPQDPLVLIASGTVVGTANLSRESGGSLSTYAINVEFDRNLSSVNWDQFNFQLGNGQCANDWMAGSASESPVPIPGTLFLLGSGLLAICLTRRRKPALKVLKAVTA